MIIRPAEVAVLVHENPIEITLAGNFIDCRSAPLPLNSQRVTAATFEDILGSIRIQPQSPVARPDLGDGITDGIRRRLSCTVMDEDRSGPSKYIVRVELVDGEVVAVAGAWCDFGGGDGGV